MLLGAGLFALAFMVRFLRLVLTGITPDMKRGGRRDT